MSSNSSFIDSLLKTPDKSINNSKVFSPTGNITPSKDLQGPAKTAYAHASTLNSYIVQWNSLQTKGTKICQCIKNLKLHEIIGEDYPKELSPLCLSLMEITQSMSYLVEGMATLSKQFESLGKLSSPVEPIINTWTAVKLAEEVRKIAGMYKDELTIKILVRENIAHCRDLNLTEIYVGFWKSSLRITDQVFYFLAEMGFNSCAVT